MNVLKIFKKSALLLLIAGNLSGCGTLQSWFPDKEKDYQFTSELPPLIIPPDLMQKPKSPTYSSTVETVKPLKQTELATTQVNRPALEDAETTLSRNEIQISLTHENTPTLNLNVPSARAWRIVGKALSRKNIEVTKRDQEKGQIHILIADSQAKSEQETSLLDDTMSAFNPFGTSEHGYVLQFHETNSKTAVTVLNEELQVITDEASEKLLSSLFDEIKADLSK